MHFRFLNHGEERGPRDELASDLTEALLAQVEVLGVEVAPQRPREGGSGGPHLQRLHLVHQDGVERLGMPAQMCMISVLVSTTYVHVDDEAEDEDEGGNGGEQGVGDGEHGNGCGVEGAGPKEQE